VTDLLLGIDVGTSACKAVLLDPDGLERANGQSATPWERVATGAEIECEALYEAAVAASRAALAGARDGRVRAVGVTSMAETGALLDDRGRPLARAIAWHDARGHDESLRLADELGADRFIETTGLPVSPLCSLAKLRWLGEHGSTRTATRWLNVAEWIVRRLGGRDVAELSLASRTGLLDLSARAPFADALAWAELPGDLLGELVTAGTPAGTAHAPELPECRDAVLTVAGHDHLVAGVGVGVVAPGDVLDSCGTAEALVRVVAPPLGGDQVRESVAGGVTVGWHLAEERQALLGSLWSGLALREVLDELRVEQGSRAKLSADALALDAASAPALDLEFHSLDRPPLRLPAGVAAERIWRGAIDAVGAEVEAVLAHIDAVAGPRRRVVVTGGWARDEAVLASKAALGAVETPPVVEAGARGAALLGGVAAGIYESVDTLPSLPIPAAAGRS
jgi:sugar (pentulose or hexulose) kinase